MLSHGMKQAGSISIHHLGSVVLAIRNPWVAVGILLLLAFFASYMNALSWADLTYVLPATSLGYVLLALVAKFALHEQISLLRWLGIALISGGVGFVAGGPALTRHECAQFDQRATHRAPPHEIDPHDPLLASSSRPFDSTPNSSGAPRSCEGAES